LFLGGVGMLVRTHLYSRRWQQTIQFFFPPTIITTIDRAVKTRFELGSCSGVPLLSNVESIQVDDFL